MTAPTDLLLFAYRLGEVAPDLVSGDLEILMQNGWFGCCELLDLVSPTLRLQCYYECCQRSAPLVLISSFAGEGEHDKTAMSKSRIYSMGFSGSCKGW